MNIRSLAAYELARRALRGVCEPSDIRRRVRFLVRVTIHEKRNKHHFCGAFFGDEYYYEYYGNFAFGEYTLTLRLESKLSDLRT